MQDITVNGVTYFNVIYCDKGFIVQETGTRHSGKYNNKYRLQNLHGEENNHTHLNSLDVCKAVISLVSKKKLPRDKKPYVMRSCIRVSTDKAYANKVEALIQTKTNKGRKAYYDKRVGVNGRCNQLRAQ